VRSSLETVRRTVSLAFGRSLLTVLKLSSGKKKHVLVRPI
jgi:hypothetical protein